jgi:hypothetical protein
MSRCLRLFAAVLLVPVITAVAFADKPDVVRLANRNQIAGSVSPAALRTGGWL